MGGENARVLECAERCVAARAAMDGLRLRESVRGRSVRENVEDIRMSFLFCRIEVLEVMV